MKKSIILVVVIAILAAGYFVLKTRNPSFQIPSFMDTGGDSNTNTGVEDSDLNLVTPQDDIVSEIDALDSVDVDGELKDIDVELNNL